MMTPRENLKAAIDFRHPERLPINGYGEQSDAVFVWNINAKPPGIPEDCDQWSCRWERTDQPNMGQVKGHPLPDLDALRTFPWPDPEDPRRLAHVGEQLAAIEADPAKRVKYRGFSVFMLLWERMQALWGFENSMISMMENDPRVHALADRLTDWSVAYIRAVHRRHGNAFDAFNFTEDWGTETDLMVSPKLFRSFFLPRYQRIFGAAHDCGYHVWMHSCGRINRGIPTLIEAGVNILNMQQPLTNGIAEIGREFAGKVCFETLCDIQKTLPKGDMAEIHSESAALMRAWGTPAGGFILGDYGDAAAIGADPAVKSRMVDAFLSQDPWRTGWKRGATG